MNFGKYLRQLRNGKYSQRELAKLIGVSHPYISKIENGVEPPPSEELIIKMAEVLGIDYHKMLSVANKLPSDLKELITKTPKINEALTIASDKMLSDNKWDDVIELISDKGNKYKSLFHDNKSIMLLIDPVTFDIFDANAAACMYYGYTMNEMSSMSILDLLVVPLPELQIKFIESLKPNKDLNMQTKLSNGEIREVAIYNTPINLDEKDYIYSSVYDITDQINAYKTILESSQKCKIIFSNVSDMIFLVDINSDLIPDKIVDVNLAVTDKLEISKDKLVGKNIESILSEIGVVLSKNDYAKINDVINKDIHHTVEATINSASDKKYDMEFKLRRVFIKKEVLLVTGTDISNKKITSDKLSESHERMRQILSYDNNFVATVNKEGLILYSNSVPNINNEDNILGKYIYKYIHKEDISMIKKHIENAFKKSIMTKTDVRAYDKDGILSLYTTSIGPIIIDGKVREVMLMIHGIKECNEQL